MAFLSIIVPVYNKEKHLDRCLQSILNQSFADFELILINDGSTDGSGLKCDEYKNKNQRVVVFHQINEGVSSARNKGLEIATGEYIGFIDADDRIESNMYEVLVTNVLNTSSDISICTMRQPTGRKAAILNPEEVKIFDRNQALSAFLKGELDFSANNKIYKKEIAKEIKFEGRMFEDVFYTYKAFSLSKKNVFVRNELYHYLISENSVSVSKFDQHYLEPVGVTKKIVNSVPEELKEDAKAFDLIMNISLLNLILFAGRKKHPKEYELAVNNLKSYSDFVKTSKVVKMKHKAAYHIFKSSPAIYSFALKAYCLLVSTEVATRT